MILLHPIVTRCVLHRAAFQLFLQGMLVGVSRVVFLAPLAVLSALSDVPAVRAWSCKSNGQKFERHNPERGANEEGCAGRAERQ